MNDLTIKRLGHQGDGIADGADGDIYLPFTLPGEVVEFDANHFVRIVTPSSDRVKAPCRHFKTCGGCALQHGADAFVAAFKTDIIRTALAAQGLSTTIKPIETSPANSRRRATLSGRRTKKGALVGLHARGSDTIIEIPSCTLLDPAILDAMAAFEALTVLGASRKGLISIAATVAEAGLDVSIMGARAVDGPLLVTLAAIPSKYGFARLSWNGEIIAALNPPEQQFDGISVTPPAGGFLQATLSGQNSLIMGVQQALGDVRKVVDLFAGCGTFSLPLSRVAEIHAVESEDDALAALSKGHRAGSGLKPLSTETRDLFRRPLLASELDKFDAAIIDPPRAGAEAQIAEICISNLAKVAYVSCNSVTFARDAKSLIQAGFEINWLKPVDQFRWSAHVELVAAFSRI